MAESDDGEVCRHGGGRPSLVRAVVDACRDAGGGRGLHGRGERACTAAPTHAAVRRTVRLGVNMTVMSHWWIVQVGVLSQVGAVAKGATGLR
ncbi:hypothetical protein GCM10023082_34900 [Streptomyces tremellae]|uniref:Uncharacterized protein n=1 Tax=Streptomyces tremellae TaxID=1124239 RepID=A0ABP7FDL5_9ACTN